MQNGCSPLLPDYIQLENAKRTSNNAPLSGEITSKALRKKISKQKLNKSNRIYETEP